MSTLDAQRLFAPEPHDEPIVLRNRTLRPGTDPAALSRFSDHVWQLTPAHPDAHVTVPALRWTRFPHELVDLFKTFVLAALDHPIRPDPATTDPAPGPASRPSTTGFWIC